ncbi:MAG: DNA polymerase I [Clostridiales bacterium]|nr:DNA polymerase I [Clostridiales bacterium]
MNGKLVLIDGHSILNRAFYGVPPLTNAKGLHTNAVYGFLNIMFKILEEEQPDYLAVAFDVKAPTFRHKMFEAYKGTRKPMPQELHEQVPVMKELLKAMGILIMEQPGLEADDILGTMAKRAEQEGLEVSLVSGDRDLLQIASEHIKIRIPKTKSGRTEIEDYYAADVKERYQVTPAQFIELKALMGDTADNIPGVPKVGEKTATELMVQFGSLDGIYSHIEEVAKKSIRESLTLNRELADLSKALATIEVNADISYRLEEAKIQDFYTKEAYVLCKELEFKNMLGRFEKGSEAVLAQTEHMQTVTDLAEAERIFAEAEKTPEIGLYLAEEGKGQKGFYGLSICYSEQDIYFLKAEGFLTEEYFRGKLSGLYGRTEERGNSLSCFQVKHFYDWFGNESLPEKGTLFDILIGAYLLNPLKNDYEIEDIAGEHLGLLIPGKNQVFGKLSMERALLEKEKETAEYICFAAYTAWKAGGVIRQKLRDTGMEQLFDEIEMPLSFVLYDMEKIGVRVKREELKAYGEALVSRIGELETSIHEKAGESFNINSPKQLGEILFGKLGISGGKKTKTGYSTAADVLEKLAPEYPIVDEILEYRGLSKLKSTYADGLSAYIGEDERIHSNFNQTITATGRISSTEPNLQNIPMRMELGRRIRKVFVPQENCLFMDADYSQIELRVLAHMSGDGQLIEAYHTDADIHRITASKVFHTPFEEVTDLQRRNAKAVNFGIVYGISSFGLSQDLSITRKEADEYIEQYFSTYPKVKQFLNQLVEDAKKQGYVTTMFGRRRPVPELSSSNFMQRSFGERVAMNSPIQGTAADIIKIAMIQVWKGLKEAGLSSRLILQVHDELLLEVPKQEKEQAEKILSERMQKAAELAVDLVVDLHTGENWYEAK